MIRRARTLSPPLALVLSAAATVFILFGPGATRADAHSLNGGGSIATAPTLPLGHTVASGWSQNCCNIDNAPGNGEFWKLKMNAGDRLVIDTASTTSDCDSVPALYIYAPSVTDYTISQTNPVADLNNGASKYEYKWVAPSSGSWILFFSNCETYSYTFNATVQLFTATALKRPPAFVRLRSKLRLSGTTAVASTGTVLLKISGPHKLRINKLVQLAAGRFHLVYRPSRVGRYYFKAVYGGDSQHRPSQSPQYSVRVIRG
jgi:hypothetical protein